MVYNSNGQVRKSLYIFLSALLGVFLFLILHRLVIYFYFLLVIYDYQTFAPTFVYPQFVVWEYFTLIISLLLGAWYGVWLGLYWYKKIYEEKSWGGIVESVANQVWPKTTKRYNLKSKIEELSQALENDVIKVQDLGESLPQVLVAAPRVAAPVVKKRVVRRKTVKKNKATML